MLLILERNLTLMSTKLGEQPDVSPCNYHNIKSTSQIFILIFDLQVATPGHSSWQHATGGNSELRRRTRDGACVGRAGEREKEAGRDHFCTLEPACAYRG